MSATVTRASARPDHVPGNDWRPIERPEAFGITPAVACSIDAALDAIPATSFMAVTGGDLLYTYGDIANVSYLASTRKSILSMLMGKPVTEGTIDLDLTMEQLGIEEEGGLLPIERRARLRDLLVSCSGVYHEPGSPGSNMRNIPERGSKEPGSYFHYNNWDFNVLGAAFEKLTGRSVFDAFAAEFAGPLQMQDFDRSRQRMLGYAGTSRYLAYHFFLSARDMARLGLLMARDGIWNGQEIVPPTWVRDSTAIRVPEAAMNESRKSRIAGYSYLWWVPKVSENEPEWQDAFIAAGHFGQFILVMPAIDMVFVCRRAITDAEALGRNDGSFRTELSSVTMEQFLDVVDLVLAARRAKG